MKISVKNLRILALVALIKVCLFTYFAINFSQNWPADRIINKIFIWEGDSETYLQPVENLAHGNGYSTRLADKNGTISYAHTAARMPGMLPVYGPVCLLFSEENSRFLLVLLQLLTDIISVFVLALIAKKLFFSDSAFYITLLLYSISSFVSIFNHYGMSECFATAALIFSFYYFLKYRETKKNKEVLLSGMFLCWAVFMRPALGLNFVLFPIFIFVFQWKNDFFSARKFFVTLWIFGLPFLLADACWTIRNEAQFGKFIPLEAPMDASYTKVYPPQQIAIQELVTAWGGDIQKWIPGTDGYWFIYEDVNDTSSRFSENQLSGKYTMDSLLLLRRIFRESLNPKLNMMERNMLMRETVSMSKRFKRSYQEEKPLRYYLVSKLTEIRRFLFVRTLHHLPFPKLDEMNFIQKAIKVSYLALYYLVLLGGMAGMLLLLFKRNYSVLLFALIPVSQIVLHAGWFGYIEHRYFVPVYPFMLLFSAYVLAQLFSQSKTPGKSAV